MKLQLVHIDNYLVAVDDSEPKIGDIVLEEYVDGTKGLEQIDTLNDIDVLLQKRIIHHLPLNNAPVLEGMELLPPLEEQQPKLPTSFDTETKQYIYATHN